MGLKASTTGLIVQQSRVTAELDAAITTSDYGKAVSIVAGVNTFKVKLAADGDTILGKLETVEIPSNPNLASYGMVTLLGGYRLPCDTASVFVTGDTVIGAGAGLVKKGTGTGIPLIVTDNTGVSEGYIDVIRL